MIDLNPCCCAEAWHAATLAAQQHGEASWKHLTCCDTGACIQMSTMSTALHHIRGLGCDFLLNLPAKGLLVHQVEGEEENRVTFSKRSRGMKGKKDISYVLLSYSVST